MQMAQGLAELLNGEPALPGSLRGPASPAALAADDTAFPVRRALSCRCMTWSCLLLSMTL